MSSLEIAERIMEAEERGELLSALVSLERRRENDELARTISELHNTRRINLVSDANLSAIASLERHEFWSAVNLINDTIPTLDCSHRELLSLVSTLVKAAGNDGAAGQPNLALIEYLQEWGYAFVLILAFIFS